MVGYRLQYTFDCVCDRNPNILSYLDAVTGILPIAIQGLLD
jgi:hypothetical protein